MGVSTYSDLTVVSGTTITSTWGNIVRDSAVSFFASTSARDSAIGSPDQGMVCWCGAILYTYDGSQWVQLTEEYADVSTQESTTSTSYTNLSTSGPAITIDTGTTAFITFGCSCFNNASNGGASMSVAVSGASTVAAANTWECGNYQTATTTSAAVHSSRTYKFTGLTAGSNTFTAKYGARFSGGGGTGTATFEHRWIRGKAI